MLSGINIEEVKRYNATLKQYQDKASQVRAGIEFNTQELNRLCQELTVELGIQVTPENIRQIREERLKKIQNNLEVGTDILNRIKAEEEAINNSSRINLSSTTIVDSTVATQKIVPPSTVPQGISVPPLGSQLQSQAQQGIPVPPLGSQPQSTEFNNIGSIPPIFSI